jgi:hypothetical protein
MNYLPVVGRELRVAARKRSSFWLRVAAAATALAVGAFLLALNRLQGGGTPALGSELFYALAWMCLAVGICSGLFFTSDCLSEEKREGTLGLLFLTELRGFDVVLGKLLATSLRGGYALVAVLPIMAVTQLMGGVTGPQYWKTSLALLNALFCSLSAGMFVSVLTRDSQKALAGTFLVLLLLALGGPCADLALAGIRQRGFQPLWSLSSPGYVLAAAGAWGGSPYWDALGITQVLGWGMLVFACARVPHTWQEKKRAGSGASRGWSYVWRYGGARRRMRLRHRLLERQPIAWLACRERWQAFAVWLMAILSIVGLIIAFTSNMPMELWFVWNYVGGLFTLALYLWAASQSCRFFVEARRSGLMELILAAPVTERQIVRGQWRGLLRMFGVPAILLLSVYVASTTLSQLSSYRMMSQAAALSSSAATNATSGATSTVVVISRPAATNAVTARRALRTAALNPGALYLTGAAGLSVLATVTNLVALTWFGMWMGMTSRTANLATLKTLLFVQIIPALVISSGSAMVVGLIMAGVFARNVMSPSTSWLQWWPLMTAAFATALAVLKDTGFILWSRNRLYTSFREQALQSPAHTQTASLPPPIPAVAKPPLIPVART